MASEHRHDEQCEHRLCRGVAVRQSIFSSLVVGGPNVSHNFGNELVRLTLLFVFRRCFASEKNSFTCLPWRQMRTI